MELHFVESSMIQALAYDAEHQVLLVVFNSGKVYQYFEVPPQIYEELMAADSMGSYMNSYVIDRYPYRFMKKK